MGTNLFVVPLYDWTDPDIYPYYEDTYIQFFQASEVFNLEKFFHVS